MPQVMTEKQAKTKICPFMSRVIAHPVHNVSYEPVNCLGADCACWGWVDPEEGEINTEVEIERKDMPKKEIPIHIAGSAWICVGSSSMGKRWMRVAVIGPRRGKCEAMSPEIIVETS